MIYKPHPPFPVALISELQLATLQACGNAQVGSLRFEPLGGSALTPGNLDGVPHVNALPRCRRCPVGAACVVRHRNQHAWGRVWRQAGYVSNEDFMTAQVEPGEIDLRPRRAPYDDQGAENKR